MPCRYQKGFYISFSVTRFFRKKSFPEKVSLLKTRAIIIDNSLCGEGLLTFRSRRSRDSAGAAEERNGRQPERIDGPRRA